MSFLNRQFEDLFEWFYLDLPKGFLSTISGTCDHQYGEGEGGH
jgi:hypothetical protein